jgi:hypothetical protein
MRTSTIRVEHKACEPDPAIIAVVIIAIHLTSIQLHRIMNPHNINRKMGMCIIQISTPPHLPKEYSHPPQNLRPHSPPLRIRASLSLTQHRLVLDGAAGEVGHHFG